MLGQSLLLLSGCSDKEYGKDEYENHEQNGQEVYEDTDHVVFEEYSPEWGSGSIALNIKYQGNSIEGLCTYWTYRNLMKPALMILYKKSAAEDTGNLPGIKLGEGKVYLTYDGRETQVSVGKALYLKEPLSDPDILVLGDMCEATIIKEEKYDALDRYIKNLLESNNKKLETKR
jgi:hypothetical protein